MLWFFLAVVGYFFLAVNNLLDKFVLTKSVPSPAVLTVYSTVPMLLLLALTPFGVELLFAGDWIWAVASGIAFGLGLYFLFAGVRIGEQSHIAPFNGAMVAFFTFLIASFVLGEELSGKQVLGLILLVVGSIILSFEQSRKHTGLHIGFLWAAVSGLCFAISHVTAKYVYEAYPFLTGLIWTKVGMALVGLAFLLLSPAVRKAIFASRNKTVAPKTFGKKHALLLVYASRIVSLVGVLLVQYAIAIGNVSLVTAMAGIQFVLLFILIYLFTVFLPAWYKETFTRRETVALVVGIVLVGAGLAHFVV